MSLQKASSVQALVCVYNTEDIPAVLMVKGSSFSSKQTLILIFFKLAFLLAGLNFFLLDFIYRVIF